MLVGTVPVALTRAVARSGCALFVELARRGANVLAAAFGATLGTSGSNAIAVRIARTAATAAPSAPAATSATLAVAFACTHATRTGTA